jgi:hypothetical protein
VFYEHHWTRKRESETERKKERKKERERERWIDEKERDG